MENLNKITSINNSNNLEIIDNNIDNNINNNNNSLENDDWLGNR